MNRWIFEKIRKNEDLKEQKTKERLGKSAGIIGLIMNITLAIVKTIIGLSVQSISILADGVNNFIDTTSSLVTILSFKFAYKPPDEDHPYGHGRIEYLAAIAVSVSVIAIGASFVKSSIEYIIKPKEVIFNPLFLGLMIFSIIIKAWSYFFYKYFAKKLDSQVLRATALDSFSDIITTLVVLIPFVTSPFTSLPIDGAVGLAVSVLIIINGFQSLIENVQPLIGGAPPKELMEEIQETILEHPSFHHIHDVIYEDRGGGSDPLLVLSVEMPGNLPLSRIHNKVDAMENLIREKYKVHLVIHADPKNHLYREDEILLHTITHNLDAFDNITGIYDFKNIERENRIRLDIELESLDIDLEDFEKQVLQVLDTIKPKTFWDLQFFQKF